MITIRGKGWVELEFPLYDSMNNVSTIWKTFGRIIASDTNTVTVEYYNYENTLVKQVFRNEKETV